MDFEQLYTTYFRKVYGFALSLSRNAHMAEEITQETFYRVLRNPDAFEGRSSVDTYLCSIAHHQYVSMLRRQKHIDFRTAIPRGSCICCFTGWKSRIRRFLPCARWVSFPLRRSARCFRRVTAGPG